MSARQGRNVQHLLIGAGEAAGTPTADVALSTGAIASLNTGEIGIFNPAGLRIVEGSAGTGEVDVSAGMDFFLALGGSSPLQRTPVIKGRDIISMTATAYSAPAEQSDYLGYNGASGSIEVFNNNLYMVDVYIEDYLTSSHDGRYIKHFQYKSDSNATQAEIAIGLAGSAIANWSREAKDVNGDPFMQFKALSNEALAATHAFDNALTVTKGSKVITASGADYNGGTLAVVGDFVRIPDTDVTCTLTDAVYEIVAISGNDMTLDRPYQGTTGTRSTTDENQVITAAQGAANDWGIFMTGVDKPYSVGKEFHKKIRYNYSLSEFGSTTTTSNTTADEGVGAFNAVSDLEWFCKGNQGETYRMGEPTIFSYTTDVNSAIDDGYDFLEIVVEQGDLVGFQSNVGPMQVTIATPADAPGYMTNGTDGLRDVLEAIGVRGVAFTNNDLDV